MLFLKISRALESYGSTRDDNQALGTTYIKNLYRLVLWISFVKVFFFLERIFWKYLDHDAY